MSKLLINERPIMILPTLAVKIGLNESIMLQQVHYWLLTSSHEKKGKIGSLIPIKIGKNRCRFGP